MNKIKLIFISIIATFIMNVLHSQDAPTRYQALNWNSEQGFYFGRVNCMIQDKYGFLWIGTEKGLNRFDGNHFKLYTNSEKKNNSIPGNYILNIVEDSLHNLWIGSDKGLTRYIMGADTFSLVVSQNVARAIPFWCTYSKIYCLENSSTIVSYDTKTAKKSEVIKFPDSIRLDIRISFSVFDSSTQTFWILPFSPTIGLCKLSLSTGKIENLRWNCFKNIPQHQHFAEGMCYDANRNCIWINNSEGLIKFNIKDQQFHWIKELDGMVDYGVGIAKDVYQRIWIGTGSKDILIYDPSTGTVQQLFAEDQNLATRINNMNFRIYCTPNGMAWIGYWIAAGKGLTQLIPVSNPVIHYGVDGNSPKSMSSTAGRNMVESQDGKIWISTWGGLNIFDPRYSTFQVIKQTDISLNGKKMPNNSLDFLGASTDGNMAFISLLNSGEILTLNIATKEINHVPTIRLAETADDNTHYVFTEDKYATMGDAGSIFAASRSDGKEAIFLITKSHSILRQMCPFSIGKIDRLVPVNDEMLFIRMETQPNLTYRLKNGSLERIITKLDSLQWNDIVQNPKDNSYWVAFSQKIIHYDNDFAFLKQYDQKDGLPLLDVLSIQLDLDGNIWSNTERSISRLNVKTGEITTLSQIYGLPVQSYHGGPIVRDNEGDLYFFGYSGLDRIRPQSMPVFPPTTIYIKSIDINQEPFQSNISVMEIDKLHLDYTQNSINISTGTLDYYSKGLNRIRYKLEESAEWQYAPDNYVIHFEKLIPGNYTLEMQASNASNTFSGPTRYLQITIDPAFWNTWWFRTIVAILLVLLVYIIIRLRISQKFKLQIERTEKEKMLSELQQKTSELEMQVLRAQMNPHFIFNSLNSINRFILQNNRAQASEYLTKFSKLVRLILQNSQAKLITLESELESLALYLDLEALRFDYRFDYKISIAKDLDVEALKIPPLVIQPYVENAIWHGLMHKEEKGQLDIELSEEDQLVFIKITDNGIGRNQAELLASKSATRHKSMGLKITSERIDLFRKSGLGDSGVKINDLINPDGKPAGTEVIIRIPVIYT
ncbi:MAG: hypothetical protein C5B52_11175 [Bacteroidetes bacterium]|nr:MAG: hypothetical protein C5B52_11175 [Bacteroidota bacterium]